MKLIVWLIAVPVALVVIAFAIANRGAVDVLFDPLPYVLEIPIWALAVGGLLVGFLLGALIRWLLDHKTRRTARQTRRRARLLEREVAELRARLDARAATGAESGGDKLSLDPAAARANLPAPTKDVA